MLPLFILEVNIIGLFAFNRSRRLQAEKEKEEAKKAESKDKKAPKKAKKGDD